MYFAPYVASLIFGWSLWSGDENAVADVTVSNSLDFAALAVIFAGVFIVARYRAALDVSESSASSWEKNWAAEKVKYEQAISDLVKETAKVTALEQRPDLSTMEHLLGELVRGQAELAESIRATQ